MARVISGSGYYMVTPPLGYPGQRYIKGRYVYEHRLVVEEHLGRLLSQDEVVHHINGDKLDNRITNLEVLTASEHINKHNPSQKKGSHVVCAYCEKTFYVRPYRLKSERPLFCSRQCVGHYYRPPRKAS